MLELKEYQRGALDALTRWLEALRDTQRDSETTIELLQQRQIDTSIINELRNYPKSAWQRLKENGNVAATAGEHVDRTDEANRPIPQADSSNRAYLTSSRCSVPSLFWTKHMRHTAREIEQRTKNSPNPSTASIHGW